MRIRVRWRLCACLLAAVAARGDSQPSGAIVGAVRDSGGAPIRLASILAAGVQALSDSAGRFLLERVPAGKVTVNVRRLGFEPRQIVVELMDGERDSLVVTLRTLPQTLPEVTAAADAHLRIHLAEFFRHRETGMGRYLDRAQMTKMRVSLLSDVLRRLPGVRVSPDRNGRYILRMGRSTRNCPPDFWIDNVRAPFLNVDDIPLQDIEAIEVYNGPGALPPEYNHRFGNPACGAIVIWTRVPG